jgi:hypothetical protein
MTDSTARKQETCPNPGCGSIVRSQRRRSTWAMGCPPENWRWITNGQLGLSDDIECSHLWHDNPAPQPTTGSAVTYIQHNASAFMGPRQPEHARWNAEIGSTKESMPNKRESPIAPLPNSNTSSLSTQDWIESQKVQLAAGATSEEGPTNDNPTCSACGTKMVPDQFRCVSCGLTTGLADEANPTTCQQARKTSESDRMDVSEPGWAVEHAGSSSEAGERGQVEPWMREAEYYEEPISEIITRHAPRAAPSTDYARLCNKLYRSLKRLSLAIEGCSSIGFEESSPTTNAHHASIWNDLNEAQRDAKLKLKHFSELVVAPHAAQPMPINSDTLGTCGRHPGLHKYRPAYGKEETDWCREPAWAARAS